MLFKRSKIRTKFLIICTLSIWICAALVFFIAAKEHKDSYAELVENSLLAMTENFADDLLLSMSATDDPFFIRAQLLRFEKYKHVHSVTVYNPDGEALERYISPATLQYGRVPAAPVFNASFATLGVRAIGEKLTCMRPIGEIDSPVGYVYIVHDFTQPVEQNLGDLLFTALPAVILVLIMSLVSTYWALRSFLNPLVNLSEFTKKVEKTGNYKLSFNVKGRDEIATLATSVNDMLHRIDKENQRDAEQKKAMFRLANYDQLTGLPNRRYVMMQLEEKLVTAKKEQSDFALIFFDLDDFKSVNDRMGHDIGDQLLLEVSKVVKQSLSDGDIFARLGGDEFLIITETLNDYLDVEPLITQIQRQLEEPLHIDRWMIHTGVSMGVSFANSANYHRDSIISNADIAMYEAKAMGKGNFRIFQEEMLKKNRRRIQIVSQIPNALENNEFKLVYQPKISSQGYVVGLEALIRWESPQLGFVSPGEFIPIAESGGQIGHITKWVISQVIKELDSIKAECGEHIRVSLNISSEDLKNEHLKDYILHVLPCQSMVFENIQFEITESSYLGDIEHANQFFADIRKHGGSIALDDFGTGFSSLSYLTQIEIDTLKIDRAFILNCLNTKKDRLILQSILRLAHNIGLNTCCEGIETEEQAIHLLENGCHEMQGYYFAKPVRLEQLKETKQNAEVLFTQLNQTEQTKHL